ncbi:hypothetical protein GCK72_009789 [Caenorhabditis remanei]|uniref:Uncharacterized protein n=1 Tax=Caenorhabditis remanei TaxID=31234 RepID=A0A2P4UWX3_CAERE|nr:hypothetical protein GCK72_009789 [Caenorhabditis remanei]KAF1761533.1 hypothetical protein GCK72_009789 [Caenorhabditis remanei]
MDNKKEDGSSKSDSSKNVTSSTGEALQNCTESEWDASDEPYSAELLNVKKKPNRVNVFSATEKNMETVIVTEVSPPQTPLQPKPVIEHHNLARLIQKSCQLLLEKTTAEGTEVHLKMEFPDWRDSA